MENSPGVLSDRPEGQGAFPLSILYKGPLVSYLSFYPPEVNSKALHELPAAGQWRVVGSIDGVASGARADKGTGLIRGRQSFS